MVSMTQLPFRERLPGDVEGQNILLHVLPEHRGQQFRVRVDIRARLQNGLKGSSVRRPPTQQPPPSLLFHLESSPIFIIPGAGNRHGGLQRGRV